MADDPVRRALESAPYDDEPVTPEEEAAVQEARDSLARGERTYTMDEVRAELDALEIEREAVRQLVGRMDDEEIAEMRQVAEAVLARRKL